MAAHDSGKALISPTTTQTPWVCKQPSGVGIAISRVQPRCLPGLLVYSRRNQVLMHSILKNKPCVPLSRKASCGRPSRITADSSAPRSRVIDELLTGIPQRVPMRIQTQAEELF